MSSCCARSRRSRAIPTAGEPGMVTLLPGDRRRSAAGQLLRQRRCSGVDGLGGNDAFVVDGATVAVDLIGAAGDDTFTFGQVYGTPRTTAAGIAPDDVFPTTETTRGWVSNGPTGPLRVFGGSGNDVFTVNSNLVTVSLLGQERQ